MDGHQDALVPTANKSLSKFYLRKQVLLFSLSHGSALMATFLDVIQVSIKSKQTKTQFLEIRKGLIIFHFRSHRQQIIIIGPPQEMTFQ